MILVVTNKFTKYIHLVPTSKTIDAANMAYLFLEHVVAHHGVPKTIISDQDKLFMSKFWNTLTNIMGINHCLTIAYHPQANGQTE